MKNFLPFIAILTLSSFTILYGQSIRWDETPIIWSLSDPVREIEVNSDGDIFTAVNNNLYMSVDNGETWTYLNTNGRILRYNSDGNLYKCDYFALYKSSDNGISWEQLKEFDNQILTLGFEVKDEMFCIFTANSNIHISKDYCESWMDPILIENLELEDFHGIAIEDYYIYIATWGEGIYRSSDEGVTWDFIDHDYFIYDIFPLPNGNLIMGTVSGVFISSDHAETWERITNGLDYQKMCCFVLDNDNILYAGEYGCQGEGGGVFVSKDLGLSWKNECDGLDRKSIIELEVTNTGYIFAGISYGYPAECGMFKGLITHESSFQPGEDGWRFANIIDYWWPQSWWSQFNYNQYPFPSTWSQWPVNAQASDFTDWQLFVDMFGEDNCYLNPPPGNVFFNPIASMKWWAIKGTWGGSCYGMVASSLMAYFDKISFLELHPGIGSFTNLYNLNSLNDAITICVNGTHLYQFAETQTNHINSNDHKTPVETLQEIENMIIHDDPIDQFLVIYNQNGSGGHTVMPYKVVTKENDENVDLVFIYDPNAPANTQRYIEVNTEDNTWYYEKLPQWGGEQGMFLMDPIENYFTPPELSKETNPSKRVDELTEVYFSSDADIICLTNEGDSVGYYQNISFNNTANSHPIIPITGSEQRPIGYYLGDSQYEIHIKNIVDSSFTFSVICDSLIQSVNTHIATSGNSEHYLLDKSFSIINPSPFEKKYNLENIIQKDQHFHSIRITNIALSENDTLVSQISESKRSCIQLISNTLKIREYDVNLKVLDAYGISNFSYSSIQIGPQEVHEISIDSLISKNIVEIYIDKYDNGVFEDTIVLTYSPSILNINADTLFLDPAGGYADIEIKNDGTDSLFWYIVEDNNPSISDWFDFITGMEGINDGVIRIAYTANNNYTDRIDTIIVISHHSYNIADSIILHQDNLYNYGVNEQEVKSFRIHPNPCKNQIYVSTQDNLNNESELIVYNMSGQIMLRQTFMQKLSLDVSSLSPGVYSVSIDNGIRKEYYKLIRTK